MVARLLGYERIEDVPHDMPILGYESWAVESFNVSELLCVLLLPLLAYTWNSESFLFSLDSLRIHSKSSDSPTSLKSLKMLAGKTFIDSNELLELLVHPRGMSCSRKED